MVWVLLATACDGTSPEPPAPAAPAAPADAEPETVPAQPGAPAPAAEAGSAAASATPATTTPTAPSNGTPAEDAEKTGAQAAAPGAGTPVVAEVVKGDAPESSAPAGSTTGEPTAEESPTAKMPLTRVLLLGDSMIATGFGVKLESLLDKTAGIVAYRKGKSASGLARPDFYDWMSEGRHQALAREPDVVIVMLGGNDGQDLTTNGPSKRRVRWGSEAWNDAYAARVDRLLARVWAPGRTIVWLGLPRMDLASLERKLKLIRDIQKARVEAHPGGVYLETTPFLLNTDGELRVYGEVRGKRKTLRADDGIHFTMAGSTFLADAVVGPVLEAFGYEPPEPPNTEDGAGAGSEGG